MKSRTIISPLVLLAELSMICFLPVLRGGFLHWDDQALLLDNFCYRGLASAHWRWMCTTFLLGHWQPLTWLSYALDYQLFGMNPHGWHATNLLLHTVNAVLVYLLCQAFLKERRDQRWVSLMAALFWAVHPLRVEPVAWLATRGYLLCAAFCLLTVLFYLRAIEHRRYPWGALLCFALATISKGIGMMLPPVLLLIDVYRMEGEKKLRWWSRRAIEKIPFFILFLISGVMAFLAKQTDGGMVSIEQFGLPERIGQAFYGIWFYLLKTVSPLHLSPLYYKRPDAGTIAMALTLTISATALLFLFRKKLFPMIGTLGAFLLLIFPMLGITQSGVQIVADRFTYLAAIPFSILLAVLLVRVMVSRLIFGVLTVFLLLFGMQTVLYSMIWSDSFLLWKHSLVRDGDNARACNGMGKALLDQKSNGAAIEYFNRALFLESGYAAALQNRSVAWMELGEYEKALADVNRAILLDQLDNADQVKMLMGRGAIAERMGNSEQAHADYSKVADALKIDPVWRIRALQMRARLYLKQNRLSEGQADLEKTLTLPDPTGIFLGKSKRILNGIKKIPEE